MYKSFYTLAGICLLSISTVFGSNDDTIELDSTITSIDPNNTLMVEFNTKTENSRELKIIINSKLSRLKIYDLAGRLVRSQTLMGNEHNISLGMVEKGNYIMRIESTENKFFYSHLNVQ